MQALKASEKRKQFGIRDLKDILDGMCGEQLMRAKYSGATRVKLALGDDGKVVVRDASQSESLPLKFTTQMPDGTK